MAKQSYKIDRFVEWYFNTPDKTEESFKPLAPTMGITLDTCLKNFKTKEQWIKVAKEYLNNSKDSEMLDIYLKMQEKAKQGDVKCADWCQKFFKSDFLVNKTDEVNDYLSGIEIEVD
ncbi:hypothetical protein [Clostridium algidicarnis]|uniref:hypothetical protein n=1 Tax=Clostridium algidicarnis TaxID=37659 RepID=UPI00068A18DE|nr:hypothetical protein [Clostridium algidicarnis]